MTETLTSTDPRARAREVAEVRSNGAPVSIRNLPAGAQMVNVMGVDYIHTLTEKGGDLYLTNEGFAHAEHLQPDSWYDLKWFRKHREELEGTGAVYASPSKPIDGECLVLVVKFSRVGQKVPIETKVIRDLLSCEFNGPFEECSARRVATVADRPLSVADREQGCEAPRNRHRYPARLHHGLRLDAGN